MQSSKSLLSSVAAAASLLISNDLPAADRNVENPNLGPNARVQQGEKPDQRIISNLIKESRQDNPTTHGFNEIQALNDLNQIRYRGLEINVGESSPVITLLQARARALGVSGNFNQETEKVIGRTLELINSTMPESRRISTDPLVINLETLAPLIQHGELLKKVAIAMVLAEGQHRYLPYQRVSPLDDQTTQAIDGIISEAKVQNLSSQLQSSLREFRDNEHMLRPGDRNPTIAFIKEQFGFQDTSDLYTKELQSAVQMTQVLFNHGTSQRPIQNDGIIDARALAILIEASQPGTGGTKGISSADILMLTLGSSNRN